MADDLFEAAPTESYTEGDPAPKYKMTLEEWKRRFTDFQSTAQDNRKEQEKNYRYYDKKGQLTREERETLDDRGQPDVIINRFRVAINGILGVVSHSRTDPRALGRTPQDADSADVATDTLRYVTQRNRFDFEKVPCLKDNLLGGAHAMLIGVTPDHDVDLVRIRWEEFFYDPRSRREDYKDARYMGIAKWMYGDEVKGLLPEDRASEVDSAWENAKGGGGSGTDDTFEDRPVDQGWIDSKLKRLMVIEIYEKIGGVWFRCLFWNGGIIEEGESPYLDQYGKPCCPIEAGSCYVDLDNNRVGYAYDLIDIQDEINKRRSKALWEVSSNQIEAADPSAIEVNANEARKEAARPDGVLPYGWKKVAGTDKSAGNMVLLNEAKNEMERFSPNPAMLGRQGADTSGRALLARQQAGLIELAVVLDQFEDWELRVYKQIWMRAKQYFTDPMWLRVSDNPDDPKFVHINAPITERPLLDEAGRPVLDGNEPVMEFAQEGQPFGYKNVIAEMDIDIMIDTAPETATIMQEQITELRNMVSSNPNYAQEVPFEIFLEMTNMPRKREFIKKIQAHREQVQKAQQAQQEQQMQMAAQELGAKVQKMLAEAGLAEATGVSKLRAADQGDIRTAVQADKTLSEMGTDEARANMEGAETTANILQMAMEPAAGDTGEAGGGDQ